jgi:signal transduction histidine kinase/ActR/RegA family two-component response regulator
MWWAGAAGFAAYALFIFLPVHRGFVLSWANELVPIIVPATAGIVIAFSARRATEAKTMWWLFALGSLSWAAGDLAFTVLDHLGITPATNLTWADAFYLGLIPLWAAALVLHPARFGRRLERAGGTLDMAAVLVGAGGLAWAFVVQPLARGNHGLTSVVSAVIYPVSDLMLLTAFGALILRTRMNLRRSDIVLGSGALIFAISDLTFARLAITDTYRVGSFVDLMFEAAFMVVAVASVLARRPALADEQEHRDGAFTGTVAIAALIGLVATALITDRPVISGAAMVMGILIAARQTLLLADRRKLIVAVEDARRAAERANKAKTEFLSHMSHEIGTPLSSVLGYAELMIELSQDENVREYAKRIRNSGDHLNDIVREALDISRIEQGRLGMSLEPIELDDLVADTIDVVRPIADAAHIEIRVDGDVDRATHVMADRQRVKQILINLLSNAIKYNREDGTVLVSWNRMPNGAERIGITDTGPGIAPEALPRLFTPFERLGIPKQQVKGTGLGLALAKRMAEAMGGAIGVSSTLGTGSTFWVELPHAASLPRPVSAPAPERRRPATTTGRCILYIEDNISNVKLVEEIFRGQNVKVLTSMQGSVGVELAREHRPDIILLDRHLPDTTAEVVLAQLRATPSTKNIPVIVVSAEAADPDVEPLIAAGARAYLTKPIDVNRFAAIVDDLFAEAA